MRKYFTKKKLDSEIKRLVARKKDLRRALDGIIKELNECYEKMAMLEQIEGVRIRFGDLLEELKSISGHDITKVKLYALQAFANPLDIEETENKMRYFGNQLVINFDNDYLIWYTCGFSMFDSLSDIQADGKTLLQHCAFTNEAPNPTAFHDLEVYLNKEDVICHFNLKNLLNSVNPDEDGLLEQAIFSMIEKGNVLEVEYAPEDANRLTKKRN